MKLPYFNVKALRNPALKWQLGTVKEHLIPQRATHYTFILFARISSWCRLPSLGRKRSHLPDVNNDNLWIKSLEDETGDILYGCCRQQMPEKDLKQKNAHLSVTLSPREKKCCNSEDWNSDGGCENICLKRHQGCQTKKWTSWVMMT